MKINLKNSSNFLDISLSDISGESDQLEWHTIIWNPELKCEPRITIWIFGTKTWKLREIIEQSYDGT